MISAVISSLFKSRSSGAALSLSNFQRWGKFHCPASLTFGALRVRI